jgi:CRP-like cAMP-binding protein
MAARELVLGSPEQIEASFPKLDASQIAGLAGFGRERNAQVHETILKRGDLHHGIFVVLSGRVEVLRVSAQGETVLHVLDRGEFTGYVNLLSGRGTLVRAKALEVSLLEIDRANLPHHAGRYFAGPDIAECLKGSIQFSQLLQMSLEYFILDDQTPRIGSRPNHVVPSDECEMHIRIFRKGRESAPRTLR